MVFVHLAKTAGTTLRTSLSQHFAAEAICPALLDDLDRHNPLELARFRLFAGHFSYSSLWRIPGHFAVITLMREPKARLLSFYYYVQSHTLAFLEEFFPDLACIKGMTLARYLAEGAPALTSMVSQLGDGNLALASQRLRSMDAIGLMERFEISLAIISRRLLMPLRPVPRENVRGGRTGEAPFETAPPIPEPMTPALWGMLEEITRDDRELWRQAVRRFDRRAAGCAALDTVKRVIAARFVPRFS